MKSVAQIQQLANDLHEQAMEQARIHHTTDDQDAYKKSIELFAQRDILYEVLLS